MEPIFPHHYQALGEATHLVDIGLYRPLLGACYIVQDQDELAIIDCGTGRSLPQILQTIEALGANPQQVRWIIPTHVHLDHAGGAGVLLQACTNATLVVHPRGLEHLRDPSRLQAGATEVYGAQAFAEHYGQLLPAPTQRSLAAEDGQTFTLGARNLRFIHTPGHANHHGCVFDSHSRYLFTGDAFGLGYPQFGHSSNAYIIATTTPVAFDPDAWLLSLQRMLELQPSAVCLTHYGLHRQPELLVEQLRASIEQHRQLALTEESQQPEGRGARLREQVDRLLVERGAAHAGLPEQAVRALLEQDIELNAQGLEIWLQRRAKRARTNHGS